MRNVFAFCATIAVISIVESAVCWSDDGRWGTLKGQIVLDGEIPVLKPLVEKGDPNVRNPEAIPDEGIPDEKLVVDSKTKGIANFVIYLPKKPALIHPDLIESESAEVNFRQTGYMFDPHVMIVRTDQRVRVFSENIVTNFHIFPLKNPAFNTVITPGNAKGTLLNPLPLVEKFPVRMSSDLHPWMTAHWLIVDHPYAAVTDETGNFEISNLPVGAHEFEVWHEVRGRFEEKFSVTIEEGVNETEPVAYTAEQILTKPAAGLGVR